MPSRSKFQRAVGQLRGSSDTCGSSGRRGLKDEERKGDNSIIEIVEALGIVLR